MADAAIPADASGAYEVPLAAGVVTKVTVAEGTGRRLASVEVIHHGGDAPIYVSRTGPLEPRDPTCTAMVMPSSAVEVGPWRTVGMSLWLVSASSCAVSVVVS